jgi:hypothetical protein
LSLRLSQNQGKFGGAGLKCPPELRAARDGRPTVMWSPEELFKTVISSVSGER